LITGSAFRIPLLLALLIVSACSTQPRVLEKSRVEVTGPAEVFVVREGLHTGIVVPAGTIQSRLPQLGSRFPDSPYLEFGWGDKTYYEAEEVTSGLTLRAVFLPTDSVMRVVAIPDSPETHFADSELEALCLDRQQYSLLIGFIEHSFHKDSEGNIIDSKDGFEGDSQFFKAEGNYFLFNTCNNWTAKGLKSAGLEISPAFKFTAGSTMNYLSDNREALANPSCHPGSR
jgi:uncharacterized protein (TIGR02117 family)